MNNMEIIRRQEAINYFYQTINNLDNSLKSLYELSDKVFPPENDRLSMNDDLIIDYIIITKAIINDLTQRMNNLRDYINNDINE
jgi:hypothetical protein